MANSKCIKKHSSELKRITKRANALEGDLKHAKFDLATVEQTRDANYEVVVKAQNKANASQERMTKALQDLADLLKVAIGLVYEQVFNHGYDRVGDSYKR